MKITRKQLRQLIKEEASIIAEQSKGMHIEGGFELPSVTQDIATPLEDAGLEVFVNHIGWGYGGWRDRKVEDVETVHFRITKDYEKDGKKWSLKGDLILSLGESYRKKPGTRDEE